MDERARKILGRAHTPDNTNLRRERRPSPLGGTVVPNYNAARSWAQVDQMNRGTYTYQQPMVLPTLVLEGPRDELDVNGKTKLTVLVGGGKSTPAASGTVSARGSIHSTPAGTPIKGSTTSAASRAIVRSSSGGFGSMNSSTPGMTPGGTYGMSSTGTGSAAPSTLILTGSTAAGAGMSRSDPLGGVGATGAFLGSGQFNNSSSSAFDTADICSLETSQRSDSAPGFEREQSMLSAIGKQNSNRSLTGSSISSGSGHSDSRSAHSRIPTVDRMDDDEEEYQGPVQPEKVIKVVNNNKRKGSQDDNSKEPTNASIDGSNGSSKEDGSAPPPPFPLMDLPPHFKREGLQKLGGWTTGICDCGGECCEALFCGPVAASNQYLLLKYGFVEMPDQRQFPVPGYSQCRDRTCEVGCGFIFDALFLGLWTRYRAYTVRKRVSLHFNLERDMECCQSCCYPCCSLAQTNRELLARRCPPKSFCCAPAPLIMDREVGGKARAFASTSDNSSTGGGRKGLKRRASGGSNSSSPPTSSRGRSSIKRGSDVLLASTGTTPSTTQILSSPPLPSQNTPPSMPHHNGGGAGNREGKYSPGSGMHFPSGAPSGGVGVDGNTNGTPSKQQATRRKLSVVSITSESNDGTLMSVESLGSASDSEGPSTPSVKGGPSSGISGVSGMQRKSSTSSFGAASPSGGNTPPPPSGALGGKRVSNTSTISNTTLGSSANQKTPISTTGPLNSPQSNSASISPSSGIGLPPPAPAGRRGMKTRMVISNNGGPALGSENPDSDVNRRRRGINGGASRSGGSAAGGLNVPAPERVRSAW